MTLTANIFESGPMLTPWKSLHRTPLPPSCKLGQNKLRLAGNQIPFGGKKIKILKTSCPMSNDFHGVGIGPLSKILAVKPFKF